MIKTASICLWIAGVMFGISGLYGLWYFVKNNAIATVMGFPSYGNGPFEKIDIHTTAPLLSGFLMVCILECICGWALWNGGKDGAYLSLIIIPIEMFFYIGFALPFGPPLIVIRIVTLLLSWSSLH